MQSPNAPMVEKVVVGMVVVVDMVEKVVDMVEKGVDMVVDMVAVDMVVVDMVAVDMVTVDMAAGEVICQRSEFVEG